MTMVRHKRKPPKFCKWRFGFLKRLLVDFGRTTTLHGISYVTRNNYHWIETLIWTVVVLLANVCAISLIAQSWARYRHNPTVISIEKDFRNWEVAFPAVTGCFIDKMNTTSAHYFITELIWTVVVLLANVCAISLIAQSWARYRHNPTVISIEKDFRNWEVAFPAVTGCFIDKMNTTSAHYFITEEMNVEPNSTSYEDYVGFLNAVTNLSFYNIDVFERLAQDGKFNQLTGLQLKAIAYKLLNRMVYFSANELNMDFVGVATEVGLCHTYAGNVSHFVSLESEMNHFDVMTCNHETPLCGVRLEEFAAPIAFYVHSPYEIPDPSSAPLVVEKEMELDVSYKFYEMISSPEIRRLSARQRRCRFTDEPFSGDEFYSYNFCRMKCRMRMIVELCGCVPLFYPCDGDNVCDVKGLACAAEHRNGILERLRENPSECFCYPNCDSVEYRLDRIRRTAWKFPAPVNIIFSWSIDNFSKTRTNRAIIFRVEDLLVSFGGIAALFLGCSVMSFVEIVNFFALRWIWKVLK